MTFIIDAHEDIAYNALTFGRDYLRSAEETRGLEKDTTTPQRTGHTLLGWPEYQRGQVGVIFALCSWPRAVIRRAVGKRKFLLTQAKHGVNWKTSLIITAGCAMSTRMLSN